MIGSIFHKPGDGAELYHPLYLDRPVLSDGDDTLIGTANDDIIASGKGSDTIDAGDGNDVIGGAYNPFVIEGGSVLDTDGNAGNDFAVVGGDSLSGGAGNDEIFAGYATTVNGGTGFDFVHLDLSTMWVPWVAGTILYTFNDLGITVNLGNAAAGSVSLAVGGLGNISTTLIGIERFDIQFGAGADNVTGGAGNDNLRGGAGSNVADDTLHGGGGNDDINGQGGADFLYGDDGDDTLRSGATSPGYEDYAVDSLLGGNGNDFIYGNATDKFDGGAGVDTAEVSFWARSNPYTIDMSRMVTQNIPYVLADGTSFVGLEAISLLRMGDGNDKVTGSSRNDVVEAERGDDVIRGNAGNDRIGGGEGNDKLYGGVGEDRVDGGTGDDLLDGGPGADTMIGWIGNDTYIVDNVLDAIALEAGGTDLIKASVTYALINDVENLTLTGPSAIDGTGNDFANKIAGNGAANTLHGKGGSDTIVGAGGNDLLNGGAGADILTGGSGQDVFLFDTLQTSAERDRVTDFRSIDDSIHFTKSAFGALSGTGGGGLGALDPAQFYRGPVALTASQHVIYNPATGLLSYDFDGSGPGASIEIALLAPNLTMTAADYFIGS